jgi:RNA polymerase sigma-70 factor (sigma-E family)
VSFEDFAHERLRPLLRTATAITGDPYLAEEIVQDVLIKVSRHWADIGAKPARDAYVRRMVVNEYVSWRRKWARLVPTHAIEFDRHEPDHAERNADRDLLNRELARLPRRQQVVLALRYFEGLADPEIANTLGCGESTVRGYASRGLAALRVELQLEHFPETTGGSR